MLPRQNHTSELPLRKVLEPTGITDRVPSYGYRRTSITVLRPREGRAVPVATTGLERQAQAAPEQPIAQPVEMSSEEPYADGPELEQTVEYPEPSFTKPWTPETGLRWVRDQQIAFARQIEPSAPGRVSVYEWHLRHGFPTDFKVLKGANNMERWCEHMSRIFDRDGLSYLIRRGVIKLSKIPDQPVAPAKIPAGAMASPGDHSKAQADEEVFRQRVNVRQKMIEERSEHERRKAYAMQLLRSGVHPQLRAQHLDPKEMEPAVYWASICKMIHQTKASVVDRFGSE